MWVGMFLFKPKDPTPGSQARLKFQKKKYKNSFRKYFFDLENRRSVTQIVVVSDCAVLVLRVGEAPGNSNNHINKLHQTPNRPGPPRLKSQAPLQYTAAITGSRKMQF